MIDDIAFHGMIRAGKSREELDVWCKIGPHTVRLRFTDGSTFIYTERSDIDWCLQTMRYYLSEQKRSAKEAKKK